MDSRFRWAVVLAALVGAVAIGVVSYNAGMSHGLAISATATSATSGAASGAPVYPAPYGPYGWYRPWGFGLFGPFLFILFWFFIARLLFRGGFHRRRWYYGGPYEGPRGFDEWHRRAHERMKEV